MEISIFITLALAIFQITLSEAGDCSDKPVDVEFMEPETCYFGPAIIDYDAMFECENFLVTKISSEAYKPNGQQCVMDCMLKSNEVIKDMKLDGEKYIEHVKKRSSLDYEAWKTAIDKAVETCFPKAEEKLATLNAADFDDTKKCNPIPKTLMNCVSAMILVNAPSSSGAINDMYCTKLKDFYKTCDFVF